MIRYISFRCFAFEIFIFKTKFFDSFISIWSELRARIPLIIINNSLVSSIILRDCYEISTRNGFNSKTKMNRKEKEQTTTIKSEITIEFTENVFFLFSQELFFHRLCYYYYCLFGGSVYRWIINIPIGVNIDLKRNIFMQIFEDAIIAIESEIPL